MPARTYLKLPGMVKIVMRYFEEESREGGPLKEVEEDEEKEEAFKAEAKAEDEEVGTGG